MSATLLYIGYPKTGSTYLQKWFTQHPCVYYNGKNIGGFGNSWDIEQYALAEETEHECYVVKCSAIGFRGNVNEAGENSVPQSISRYQQKLAVTLYKIFPGAKILLITRGFSGMLVSAWNEYIVSGGVLSFEDFYEKYSTGLVAAYNYDHIISLFRNTFGEQNVIVLPFELLRDEPVKYISYLEQKLELSRSFTPPTQKINASPDTKYLRTTLMLSDWLNRLLKPFPGSIQDIAYGYYVRLLNKKKNHWLVNILSSFVKDVQPINITDEKLNPFRGNAEILKAEKLYKPYIKDYLLDIISNDH